MKIWRASRATFLIRTRRAAIRLGVEVGRGWKMPIRTRSPNGVGWGTGGRYGLRVARHARIVEAESSAATQGGGNAARVAGPGGAVCQACRSRRARRALSGGTGSGPVPLSVSHGPVPFLDWKDTGQPIESNPWALCPEHMGGHVTRRVGRDAHPVKVRSA